MAVGIALSSDVLASAVSAYTYGKNKNLDVKNGLIMTVSYTHLDVYKRQYGYRLHERLQGIHL